MKKDTTHILKMKYPKVLPKAYNVIRKSDVIDGVHFERTCRTYIIHEEASSKDT